MFPNTYSFLSLFIWLDLLYPVTGPLALNHYQANFISLCTTEQHSSYVAAETELQNLVILV